MTLDSWPHEVRSNEQMATLVDVTESATHFSARYILGDGTLSEPPRAFVVPKDFAEVFEPQHLTTLVASAIEEGW